MNRPKAIGTAAETAVVRWLRDNGWPSAERRALRGTLDAGDITGTPGIAWEVKAGEAAQMTSDASLGNWMADTEQERQNAGADVGILVLRRKGKSDPGDWWAYLWGYDFAALLITGGRVPNPNDYPVRMRLADITNSLHAAGYGDPTQEEDTA